jgi:hypothetical protein
MSGKDRPDLWVIDGREDAVVRPGGSPPLSLAWM